MQAQAQVTPLHLHHIIYSQHTAVMVESYCMLQQVQVSHLSFCLPLTCTILLTACALCKDEMAPHRPHASTTAHRHHPHALMTNDAPTPPPHLNNNRQRDHTDPCPDDNTAT